MANMPFFQAIDSAVVEEMRRDPTVFYILQGSIEKSPLLREFGPRRVFGFAISEGAMTGAGIGAAITGTRAIVDHYLAEFMLSAVEEVINEAAKMPFMSGGDLRIPVVFRIGQMLAPAGAQHGWIGHEAMFTNTPGLKSVMPSSAADAKGLMKTAIRDNSPVLYWEHRRLSVTYGREEVPDGDYAIPFGQAAVKTAGTDVTIVGYAMALRLAVQAAEDLAKEGISAEVIDPRSLYPLDEDAILSSVKKTGKLLLVEEGSKWGGFSDNIAAMVAEQGFRDLKAPIRRIGFPRTYVAVAPSLWNHLMVTKQVIADAARKLVRES